MVGYACGTRAERDLHFQSPAARTVCKKTSVKGPESRNGTKICSGRDHQYQSRQGKGTRRRCSPRVRAFPYAGSRIAKPDPSSAASNASPFHHANRRVEISAQLPGFELPKAIAVEQREFDERLAESLDAMAARIEGRSTGVQQTLQEARARLERSIQGYRPKGTSEGRFDALLLLGRKIESSILSLTN